MLCGYQVVIFKMRRAAAIIIKPALCHVNEGFNSAGINLCSKQTLKQLPQFSISGWTLIFRDLFNGHLTPLSLSLKERKNIKSITNKNYLISQRHRNENSSQKLKTTNPAPLATPLQIWLLQSYSGCNTENILSEPVELALSHFCQQNQDMTRDWQMTVSAPCPAQLAQSEVPGRQWSENGTSSHPSSTIRTFIPLASGASSKHLGLLSQISSFPSSYCKFSVSLLSTPYLLVQPNSPNPTLFIQSSCSPLLPSQKFFILVYPSQNPKYSSALSEHPLFPGAAQVPALLAQSIQLFPPCQPTLRSSWLLALPASHRTQLRPPAPSRQ